MRIVEIIPSLANNSGGAEIFLSNLCNEFVCDNELYLILLYNGINNRFKSVLDKRIKIIECNKKMGLDIKCAIKLKKIIKNIKPDCVHMHLSCIVSYFLAFGFKKTKWKAFLTIHNTPEKDEISIGNYLRKRYFKRKRIIPIAISNIISREAKKFYKIDYVPTVFNAIPLHGDSGSDKKAYDFICVAVFKPQKNHKLLINAFNELIKKRKQTTLCLIGDGPLFNQTIEYVKSLNLSEHIFFLGTKTNVSDYLIKSKIFVLSSTFEGNPIAILEAMQCGLPIIAPKVGGIPDVVENKVNGFLYDSNDLNQLFCLMLKLIDDEKMINKMGIESRNKSRTFSIDECAKNYINVFKNEQD